MDCLSIPQGYDSNSNFAVFLEWWMRNFQYPKGTIRTAVVGGGDQDATGFQYPKGTIRT